MKEIAASSEKNNYKIMFFDEGRFGLMSSLKRLWSEKGKSCEVKVKQGDPVNKGDIILVINPGVGYELYNVIANINGRIQTLNYRNPGAVVKK